MKTLSIVLGIVCLGLAVVLVSTNRRQRDQHENDTAVITDFSNQLSSAQTESDIRLGKILSLSNSVEEGLGVSSALSNRLTEAMSALASEKEQSTNLNRHLAEVRSENDTLTGRVAALTNQIAGLSQQMISNEISFNVASNDFFKSYTLLENRFRRDVAERVLVEREFNDRSGLQAQLERLRENPAPPVTPRNIYGGLDVEVESNGEFHVLSPE